MEESGWETREDKSEGWMAVCFSLSRKKQSSKKVTDLSDPSTEPFDDVYAALCKAHSEAFRIVYLKAIIFSSDLGDVARWGGGPKQIAAKQAHGHTYKHAHTHTPTRALSVVPYARVLLTQLLLETKAFLG